MQENTIPRWFRLLRHHSDRLTLPFVIGALRETGVIPSDGEDFAQVCELFQEMASYRIPRGPTSRNDEVIYLHVCSTLAVPVFSIWAESATRTCRARYPSHDPANTHLCFSTEVEREKALDLREVAGRVFKRYDHRAALSSKNYSRDGHFWRPFDEKDRSDIRKALGVPQVP